MHLTPDQIKAFWKV